MIVSEDDSGHWYTAQAEPLHSVEYADKKRKGTFRPTTLRDAKRLCLYPSVTSILKVIAKPSLDAWKQEQAILAALTLPRRENESEDSFAKRAVRDMGQQARDAADKGGRIHNAIEKHLTGRKFFLPSELEPMFLHVLEWSDENVLEVYAAERVLVNPKEGYAGTVDLVANIKGIGICLCDYKTQNVKAKATFYDEWALQLEAYRHAWNKSNEPKADHILSVVISSGDPKPCECKQWTGDNYWETFLAARDIWCFQKSYAPHKTKEIEKCH